MTSFHISKMCVCGDDGKSVKFRIIPNKLGRIPLTVKAITSEADLCPKSTVYAGDAVSRKLLVEVRVRKSSHIIFSHYIFSCMSSCISYHSNIHMQNAVLNIKISTRYVETCS